jgi:guanine deaminase
MQAKWKIIRGTFLSPVNDQKCLCYPRGAMVLERKPSGYVISDLGAESILKSYGKLRSVEILDFGNQLIVPGFLDLHFHWVQDDVREKPKNNLLRWLEDYTWPEESKFSSSAYSKKKAKEFSRSLIENGTIGGACYGSIHAHSVEHAFNQFKGDFFIGNVLMTMNSPDYLLQTKKQAKSLIEKLASKYKGRYVVTPRFAPTTDEEVMRFGAKVHKKTKGFIQSHLCETENEIDWVLSIFREREGFEDVKSYSDIYQRVGLLGEKTIMGHGIHLSKEDRSILRKTKTAVAHCPTSNAPKKQRGLGSGLFDFEQANKDKIEWGLGSDIGAGPFLSMLDVMKSFVEQNKGSKKASYRSALYRSTLKNAEILKINKRTGDFSTQKEANFNVLNFESQKVEAESILSDLFKSIKKREGFSKQVQYTFYKGELLNK